jgi:hypothetical protein
MANSTSNVTPADIAEVERRKSQCQALFNVDEFITALTDFYQLLITMGFWPQDSVSVPAQNSSASINVDLARELGYSQSCIDLMQRLPYPGDRVVYNRKLRLLEDTFILDLRNEEALREGRHPEGTDFDESPNVEGWILSLMSMSSQEGSVVLLDVKIGTFPPPPVPLVYRRKPHLSCRLLYTSTEIACRQVVYTSTKWFTALPRLPSNIRCRHT